MDNDKKVKYFYKYKEIAVMEDEIDEYPYSSLFKTYAKRIPYFYTGEFNRKEAFKRIIFESGH